MAAGGSAAAARDVWVVFEDEAGFVMSPPRARTWGRRGHTPVVRVWGRARRRISVAALACYKPGQSSRLIYRPRFQPPCNTGRKGFGWQDYRDLLVRAHIQLGGPVTLVWDNLNTHRSPALRQYAADHDWLALVHLPTYAPDLNPVEGVWSLLRRGPLANTAFTDIGHLTRTLHRGLRRVQRRPDIIDGLLAGTGLAIRPRPTSLRRDQ